MNQTLSSIKDNLSKEGAVRLALVSFLGGITLSLLELSSMMQHKEKVDSYFLGGMAIAGVLGMIGYVVFGPGNAKQAFMTGVSSPQLLGGVTKLASATAQTAAVLLMPMLPMSTAYAQPVRIPVTDSMTVIAVVKGIDLVGMTVGDSTYFISGVERLTVPRQDTILISGKGIGTQKVSISRIRNLLKNKIGAKKKEFIVEISVTDEKKEPSRGSNLLRGMFAQQQRIVANVPLKKIDIKIE